MGVRVQREGAVAPKVQSDIGKIAKTDRGYKKAFFITSRFVKDKTRQKWKTRSARSMA